MSSKENEVRIWESYSKDHGTLFNALIQLNKFKSIVEIGVATATTTKYLCEAANKTNGFVYGYDIWGVYGKNQEFQQFYSKEECEEYLNRFGFSNYELTKIDTKTKSFSELFNMKHESVDFIFIDGDHSYEGIKNDFDIVYKKLSPTGIIAFHDTLRIDGCREFLLDLRTKYFDGTYDIVDFPFGNNERRVGISLLVKRSYPIIHLNIDETCGSVSTPESIIKAELDWYNKELKMYNKI